MGDPTDISTSQESGLSHPGPPDKITPAVASCGNRHLLFDQSLFLNPPAELFNLEQLKADGLITGEATGRGKAWFIRSHGLEMVLRHFRRGGLVEKLLTDRYLGRNPANSRAWREWHLLLRLYRRGLPVPRPIAARVVRGMLFHRADLITEAIPGARPLADLLTTAPERELWSRVGATIALFHRNAVCHPDLNARNILLDHRGRVFLIDFDQGPLRLEPGEGQNLKRLLRSLRKIKKNNPALHFDENNDWPLLLNGYHSALPHPDPEKLEGLIIPLLQKNQKARVFSLEHQGKKIWVKRGAAGSKNLWHTILLILSKLSNDPFLTPTVATDTRRALLHEAAKLTELKAAGIRVPRVLFINVRERNRKKEQDRDREREQEKFLVLSDAGVSVKLILEADDKKVSREEKKRIVRQVSSSLAAMHNAGLYHSRPALRDITCKDGEIYFVDFEENLDGILSNDQAIIRDACIYIHTLFRALKDPVIRDEALAQYLAALKPAIWSMIHHEARKYRAVSSIFKLITPWLGKDGRALGEMLNFILNTPTDPACRFLRR